MSPTLAFDLPNWAIGLGIAIFVIVSIILIGVILLQRPQGGGLSAAFGGSAGAGQTAFGTKTGDALTILTCLVFAGYVIIAIFLNHGLKQVATAAPSAAPAAATTSNSAGTGSTQTPPAANTPANTPANTATPPLAAPGSSPATNPPATNPAANPSTPPTNPQAPKTEPKTEPKVPDPSAPKPTDPNAPK